MITAVIVINCLVALACLGVAWRLWRLRHHLRLLRWMMGDLTQHTEAALQGATDALIAGQQSTQRLQWRYRHVHRQFGQLQRLLVVASWGQGLLSKTLWRSRQPGRSGVEPAQVKGKRKGRRNPAKA